MKKKLLTMLLTTVAVLSITACSGGGLPKNYDEVTSKSESETEYVESTTESVIEESNVEQTSEEIITESTEEVTVKNDEIKTEKQWSKKIYDDDVTEDMWNTWANKCLEQAKEDGVADDSSVIKSTYADLEQTEYLDYHYEVNSLSITAYYTDNTIYSCIAIPLEISCKDEVVTYLYNVNTEEAYKVSNTLPKELVRNRIMNCAKEAGFRAEEIDIQYDNEVELVFLNEEDLNNMGLSELINVINCYSESGKDSKITANNSLYIVTVGLNKSDMTRDELTAARDSMANYFEYFNVQIKASINSLNRTDIEVRKDESFDKFDDYLMYLLQCGSQSEADEKFNK